MPLTTVILISGFLILFEIKISKSNIHYFIKQSETVVQVIDKNVELKCMINVKLNLTDYNNVTWMKVPRRLLTRGIYRVTPDTRFRFNFQGILDNNMFNLFIEGIKESDEGEYRCSLVLKNDIIYKVVTLIVKVIIINNLTLKISSIKNVLNVSELIQKLNNLNTINSITRSKIGGILGRNGYIDAEMVNDNSSYVMIIDQLPAKIYPPLKPIIYVEQNSKLQLVCNATGKPFPKVFWYSLPSDSDDTTKIPILNALEHFQQERFSTIHSEGQMLQISRVHRDMTGFYACVANNKVEPEARSKFQLIVKFKPEIVMTNSEIHQRLKGDTVIECVVLASPMGAVEWLHNNEKINPFLCAPLENRSLKYCLVTNRDEHHYVLNPISVRLTIFNLQRQDYGDYVCQMRTSMGMGYGLTKLKQSEYEKNSIYPKQIFMEDISFKQIEEERKVILSTPSFPIPQFQKLLTEFSTVSSGYTKFTFEDLYSTLLLFYYIFVIFL